MLRSDNFNICHWTGGLDPQQHPDPDKDSEEVKTLHKSITYQHLHPRAADVQAQIHLVQEQGPFSLQCFVMAFAFPPFIIMIS